MNGGAANEREAEAETGAGDHRTLESRRAKRAVVAAVWGLTTAFLATIGWVAGSNTGDAPVTVFRLVALPNDPATLAVAAVVVGNAALVAVAGVVALASRVDRGSGERGAP